MTAAKTDDSNNQHPTGESPQDASVLFDTEPTDCGHSIGIMTLNTPKSLNALSVDMCQLLSKQLEQWQGDEQIVALVLKGAGDKAFVLAVIFANYMTVCLPVRRYRTLMRQSFSAMSTVFTDRCTSTKNL